MTSAQTHKLRIYGELRDFFEKNSALWPSFPRLNDEIAAFKSALLAIMVNGQRQNINNKGLALEKRKARLHMTLLIVRYARVARVWAADNKNDKLVAQFSISKRHLLLGPGVNALARARSVAKALADNISALAAYHIQPSDITAINNAISDFDSLASRPLNARARKKTATESLPALFTRADTSLSLITDLIKAEFTDTDPKLVSNYLISRKVGKHHVRHTGLALHITDAATQQNIFQAHVRIPGTNKSGESDMEGIAQITRFRPGHYIFEITAEGFQTQTISKKLLRGHILQQEVALQRL